LDYLSLGKCFSISTISSPISDLLSCRILRKYLAILLVKPYESG
jgi:hypothetical protein